MVVSPSSQTPHPSAVAPRLGLFGFVVAGLGIGLAFIPEANWSDLFQHPIRVERLGEVPETTIKGIRLFRLMLVVAAITWSLQPFIQRRLEKSLPVPLRQPDLQGGSGVLVVIVLLILAGMLLRGFRLQESLWYDEIAAMISSSLHGPGPALGNYHALANHAFHSALAAQSLQSLGDQDAELALRLPAFLAGMAGIPAMFALGRAVGGNTLGLVAAGAITFMPVAILESVEARGYSMVLLLAILATLAWLRMADGRRLAVPIYALVVSLGCWTHLVFACVPLGHALQAVFRAVRHEDERAIASRWGLALLLGGVTSLTLISPLVPDLLERRTEFVALDGDEPSIFGIEGWMALLQLGGSWTWWAAWPGLLLVGFGLTEAWRWPRLRLASHAGIAGGFVTMVLVIGADSWIYARFLVFLLVPAALLQAAAIEGVATFLRRHGPAVALGTITLIAWTISLVLLPPKQPIREGVELARSLAGAESTIWSIGLGDDVAMFYTEGRGPRLIHAPRLGSGLDGNSLAVGPDVALVLYPDLIDEKTNQRLSAAGFKVVQRFDGWLDWGQGDVLVLQRSD